MINHLYHNMDNIWDKFSVTLLHWYNETNNRKNMKISWKGISTNNIIPFNVSFTWLNIFWFIDFIFLFYKMSQDTHSIPVLIKDWISLVLSELSSILFISVITVSTLLLDIG